MTLTMVDDAEGREERMEPRGCPTPGACSALTEIVRLRERMERVEKDAYERAASLVEQQSYNYIVEWGLSGLTIQRVRDDLARMIRALLPPTPTAEMVPCADCGARREYCGCDLVAALDEVWSGIVKTAEGCPVPTAICQDRCGPGQCELDVAIRALRRHVPPTPAAP